MTYTIEAQGNGNFTTLTATSYRAARTKAASLRNSLNAKVQIIKGDDVSYDNFGFPTNITDSWARDNNRWVRVNP